MPLRGAEPLPLPVSPWLPLSPSASSFSRRGLITAGAVVAARSLWRPLSPLPAGGAQRGTAAGAGAAGRPWRGGGVVGLRAAKAHRITQVARAMGQWAGAVRIVRSLARGRPCQRGSPITGAGLDPRVCDPSGTPAGIPSNGSDGEGCCGEETAGANAVVGVDVGRVVAVPVGDPPSDVTVLRQWGQASAEAMGREQTLAQLEGVAMG